jgi:hypothetical protein
VVESVEEAQKLSVLPPWLVELYDFYGKKAFDVVKGDFPDRYSELVRLLSQADPRLVIAFPNKNLGEDENEQPLGIGVKLTSTFLSEYKKLGQVHRQLSLVDGGKIDIRSERWASVVGVPIENLIADVKRDLDKLRTEGDLKVRKSIMMEFRRILRARRHLLPAELAARMDEEIAKPIIPIVTS